MATQRLTHEQREGMVMQELQAAFPGFKILEQIAEGIQSGAIKVPK